MSIISKEALVAGLRQVGFGRTGNHLHRAAGDVFHCVHFQASSWGQASSGRFTINLVVANKRAFEAWTGKPFPNDPATAGFPISERIGHLMPARRDHWWDVDERTDVPRVASEVADVLVGHGLPFFDAYPDSAAILARLRADETLPGLPGLQGKLMHAVFAWDLGLRTEAVEALRCAARDSRNAPFRSAVRTVGARLGVAEFELDG